MEDVEEIPEHKQGGIRRRAVHDEGGPEDSATRCTGGVADQQTADGATLDKISQLERFAGSYQESTAYRPQPRRVAGQRYHKYASAASGARNNRGSSLGIRAYGRQGELKGRRDG